MVILPLLVKEEQDMHPLLKPTLAKSGVLDKTEVHAVAQRSITVVEGVTIRRHICNPEDDPHSFVRPDFAVSLPCRRT